MSEEEKYEEYSEHRFIPDKSITYSYSRVSVRTFQGSIEISVVAPHSVSEMKVTLLADDAEWLSSQLQQAARVATRYTESEETER